MTKIRYIGVYDQVHAECRVSKICSNAYEHLLNPAPSQALYNHSPTGFSWGYAGSGPAQLALALLLDVTGSNKAQHYYQAFKSEVVAALPFGAGWSISRKEILAWVTSHEARSLISPV